MIATTITALFGGVLGFFAYYSKIKVTDAHTTAATLRPSAKSDPEEREAFQQRMQKIDKDAVALDIRKGSPPLSSPLILSGTAQSDPEFPLDSAITFRLIDGYGDAIAAVTAYSPEGDSWPLRPTPFKVSGPFRPTTGKAILVRESSRSAKTVTGFGTQWFSNALVVNVANGQKEADLPQYVRSINIPRELVQSKQPLDLWPELTGSPEVKELFSKVFASLPASVRGNDRLLLAALAKLGGSATRQKVLTAATDLYHREFPYTFYTILGADNKGPRVIIPPNLEYGLNILVMQKVLYDDFVPKEYIGFDLPQSPPTSRLSLPQP